MKSARAHVIVTGKVQGVFYRMNTEHKANELGLKGWVRNKPDGTVEAVFEGPEDKVEEMVEWCRKGPIGSKVEDVRIEKEEFKEQSDFY